MHSVGLATIKNNKLHPVLLFSMTDWLFFHNETKRRKNKRGGGEERSRCRDGSSSEIGTSSRMKKETG